MRKGEADEEEDEQLKEEEEEEDDSIELFTFLCEVAAAASRWLSSCSSVIQLLPCSFFDALLFIRVPALVEDVSLA